MKVTYSPIISGLSGKAADAVAASWKGRGYIRKHAIPHNPQTSDQNVVRESMTRCNTLWRSLGTEIKNWLDKYGVPIRMSGWNVFTKKSSALERTAALLIPIPPNPHVPEPLTLAGSVAVPAKITVTWVKRDVAGFTKIALFLRCTLRPQFEKEILTTLESAQTYDFTGLVTGEIFRVYAALYNSTTGEFGSSTGTAELTVT